MTEILMLLTVGPAHISLNAVLQNIRRNSIFMLKFKFYFVILINYIFVVNYPLLPYPVMLQHLGTINFVFFSRSGPKKANKKKKKEKKSLLHFL